MTGTFDGHRHCLGGIVLVLILSGFMTGQASFAIILTLFNCFALLYSHGLDQVPVVESVETEDLLAHISHRMVATESMRPALAKW